MKLYTPSEVLQDVMDFEQVKLGDDLVIKEFTGKIYHLQLYSEHYSKPLHSSSTVSKLERRLTSFLNDDHFRIPSHDITPTSENNFWVYEVKYAEDDSNFAKAKLELLSACQTKEEAALVFKNGMLTNVCIVDVVGKQALYFSRDTQ